MVRGVILRACALKIEAHRVAKWGTSISRRMRVQDLVPDLSMRMIPLLEKSCEGVVLASCRQRNSQMHVGS